MTGLPGREPDKLTPIALERNLDALLVAAYL